MLKLFPDDDEPCAPIDPTPYLRCGCLNPDVVVLPNAKNPRPYIHDACLRRIVEADLDGAEPVFPLCPDPSCDHHGVTSADGFRAQPEYQILSVRLHKEALRLAHGGRLVVLPAAPAAAPKAPKTTPTPGGVEVVSGVSNMLRILQEARVGCRRNALLDALNDGEIEGAAPVGDGKNPPWVAPRRALVAWGRKRRGLPPQA